MKQFRLFFISVLLVCCIKSYSQVDSTSANEQEQTEKVKQFHADILVKENGNLIVTETIKVYAAGIQIDHGIFRELPLTNSSTKVPFNNFYTVLKVTRNGGLELYHTKSDLQNFKIYIGSKNALLPPGTYTYKLTYEIEAQIHSYADFDEVYWNVTGNYWVFDIDNVTARVILPKGATALQTHCYTGILGSKANDCNAKIIRNSIYFTSKNLKSEEGLTVAVGFPKGIVHQPFFLPHFKMEEFLSFEKIGLALLALTICFGFYFYSWKKYGKDPLPSNEINELTDVKKLYSPASLQYIKERYCNTKTLLTTIISLSVKGAIEITGNGKQNWADGFEYFLKKGKTTAVLSNEENAVLDSLFNENDTFTINTKTYKIFNEAETKLEKSLLRQFNLKDYYRPNTKQILIGFAITISTLISYCFYTKGMIFWWPIFGFTSLICTVLLFRVAILSFVKDIRSTIACLFLSLFTSSFVFISFFAINVDKSYSALNALVLFIIISGFVAYLYLINSYTKLGVKTKTQIEKFKQELLNYQVEQNANTIKIYEENLPYAFALDIDEQWNLKFVDALKALNYTSNWITTSDGSVGFSYQTLVHFNETYTTSSSSSSSGSSGGGSSGGGGGGGGGGGW